LKFTIAVVVRVSQSEGVIESVVVVVVVVVVAEGGRRASELDGARRTRRAA